jgi:hypothetical protein
MRSEKSRNFQLASKQSLLLVLGSWFQFQLSEVGGLRSEKSRNFQLAVNSLCSWFLALGSNFTFTDVGGLKKAEIFN